MTFSGKFKIYLHNICFPKYSKDTTEINIFGIKIIWPPGDSSIWETGAMHNTVHQV